MDFASLSAVSSHKWRCRARGGLWLAWLYLGYPLAWARQERAQRGFKREVKAWRERVL